MPDLHGWISQQINQVENAAGEDAPNPWAVVALRRCAADRKILEVHSYSGGSYEPYACTGCGHDDMGAWVEHANDCETLQALAEGYGITDEEMAALDRPQSPERKSGSQPDWDVFVMSLNELRRPPTPVERALDILRPHLRNQPLYQPKET